MCSAGRETASTAHPATAAGQWSDSADGLAGGRYPYDVNCILVPAALVATARLTASGLLGPALGAADLAPAAADAMICRSAAAPLFSVTLGHPDAVRAITAYAAEVGVRPDDGLRALGSNPFSTGPSSGPGCRPPSQRV
jgi:hypothetical protein